MLLILTPLLLTPLLLGLFGSDGKNLPSWRLDRRVIRLVPDANRTEVRHG